MLKDHVLNRLMTGRCPSKSLQLRPKFHSLFLQNSFDFQKIATFKHLNRHLECTDVGFNPENGAFSTITNRQTDRQSDYCNPLEHARRGLSFIKAINGETIIQMDVVVVFFDLFFLRVEQAA